MHRAYHAVPPTMNAPDGTPTNAAFGFMSMFIKLYETMAPDAIVCAFDAGRPAFRMEALEQYKATRPSMDEELKVQFPLVENLLESMNVPVVRVKGWEGDDVLGTVAARDEALGYETYLVTGDKDAYQLVSDLTKVVTTKKGISDVVVYGPAEVEERYGVTPAQFPDFLGLKGDSSDNIPGVPGIGDKGAAKLLQNFGSIDGIYENLDKLKGKQLQNISENKEAAFTSRRVATIVRDLDFELDIEGAAFPSFDEESVIEAFHALRFNAHLAKVLALAGADSELAAPSKLDLPDLNPLRGEEAACALEKAIEDGVMVGVEFYVPAQESLFEPSASLFVGTDKDVLVFEGDEGLRAFARIVREGSFCAIDAKKALQHVYPADNADKAFVGLSDVAKARFFDIGLAAYLLNSNVSKYEYEPLCDVYLGAVLPEPQSEEARAAAHAFIGRRLSESLRAALEKDESISCYTKIDLPLVGTLVGMERVGAMLDTGALASMGAETSAEIADVKAEVISLAGRSSTWILPNSWAISCSRVLGLPVGKKNQRGYSTDAKTLKGLEEKHPIASKGAAIASLRRCSRPISTHCRTCAPATGVHTSFNQTVTTTGRLSSSNPNLQNIPVRTEFGRRIRECFVPLREGDVFVSADYSQIELRLLAHLSGEESLIDSFCGGADFHAATAARVFGIPVEEVTPELRSRAKAVNFGIVYGQQAFGLANSLGIGYKEAQEMIDRYFEVHPRVREYLDETVANAKETGYAVTMFGRKRHIPELRASNAMQRGFGERTAMNHPMQGSAADIIKLAMNEVARRLAVDGFSAQLMLQVHDRLDFSVPREELEALSSMVEEVMSGVVELKVPLLVDVQSGMNWAQAH